MSEIANEYIIETKGLSLKVGQQYLLKDIDWQVKEKENWVLFGTNGCGKTTLLSILAGFKQGTSGSVKLFGESFRPENILTMRKDIGWISTSFFEHLYTREAVLDVVLSGKFGTLGIDDNITVKDVRRAKELLQFFGLKKKIHMPFQFMSKGERQNVLIARAMMGNPRIFLLDEPCSGLDIIARENLLQTIHELSEHYNVTMIYVTHHTDEVLTDIFPKTMFLKNGLIWKQGETDQLFTTDVLSDFLGTEVEVERGRRYGYEVTRKQSIDISGFLGKVVER